jgi:dihydroorotate dehydrogenase (NAD+) catalytic subunit
MYNPSLTYQDNYLHGPDPRWQRSGQFPKLTYRGVPRFRFLGQPLFSPLGIPAGPLLHSGFVKPAMQAGFCVPVYKTVRGREWTSHPWPNVLQAQLEMPLTSGEPPPEVTCVPISQGEAVHLPKNLSITNSFGVPSKNIKEWQEDFSTIQPQAGFLPMLSFQGSRLPGESWDTFVQDTCHTAKQAAASCGFLEINLSCPNEAGLPVYLDPLQVIKLLESVRLALGSSPKLIAKIGILDLPATGFFLENAAPFIDGISAINTVSARVMDPHQNPALGTHRPTGGICGTSIYQESLAMIQRLVQCQKSSVHPKVKSLELVAVGGVQTSQQVLELLELGVKCVQMGTAAMWDLELAQDVARSLKLELIAGELR